MGIPMSILSIREAENVVLGVVAINAAFSVMLFPRFDEFAFARVQQLP